MLLLVEYTFLIKIRKKTHRLKPNKKSKKTKFKRFTKR